MTEFGTGSRATFISPYLRRPLRSLNKVLSERDELDESGPAGDEHTESGSSTWRSEEKSVGVSD